MHLSGAPLRHRPINAMALLRAGVMALLATLAIVALVAAVTTGDGSSAPVPPAPTTAPAPLPYSPDWIFNPTASPLSALTAPVGE